MADVQSVIIMMCLMGIAFAICIKLMFDAFVVHLDKQSELTTRAVNQAGEAVALNGRIITAINALVAQRIEHRTSNSQVDGPSPSERPKGPSA